MAIFRTSKQVRLSGHYWKAQLVEQFKHEIGWTNAECLESEKRLFPHKIIESAYIKDNRNRCMNLNEGVGVTPIHGKGKEGWLRRGRESLHTKNNKLCSSVVTWKTNLLEVRNIVIARNIKFFSEFRTVCQERN